MATGGPAIRFSTTRPLLALVIFTVLFVAAIVLVIADKEHPVVVLATALAPMVIGIIASTYVITEGLDMLAEMYRKARYQLGFEEGRHEGQREMQSRWEAWERESQQAREQGQPPPPAPRLDHDQRH